MFLSMHLLVVISITLLYMHISWFYYSPVNKSNIHGFEFKFRDFIYH